MQTVKLNLIPGSVLPVVNVSQYDENRQFALQVYEGATAYSLSGKSVQIRGTKPDGNGFAYDATDGVVSVSGNTVTISTTQQMTAVGGQTMAELRIKSGTTILGTINFILDVEHSALSDNTPISETEIPAIERDFAEALEEAQEAAETATTKAGEASTSATSAAGSATSAAADALKAEGYAVGKQNGSPVGSESPYYHNNAEYYDTHASEQAYNASQSATAAGNSATAAAGDSLEAEGFAVGEQNGTPVGPDSPYYHNNAAYYAQEAGQHASGGIIFKGSLAFADLPTVGMASGDEYNITDDFTTDSRFIEGAGLSVNAGTNIAWVAGNVNKWDILATGGGSGVPAGGTTDQVLAKNSNTDGDTKWVDALFPENGFSTAKYATGTNSTYYLDLGNPFYKSVIEVYAGVGTQEYHKYEIKGRLTYAGLPQYIAISEYNNDSNGNLRKPFTFYVTTDNHLIIKVLAYTYVWLVSFGQFAENITELTELPAGASEIPISFLMSDEYHVGDTYRYDMEQQHSRYAHGAKAGYCIQADSTKTRIAVPLHLPKAIGSDITGMTLYRKDTDSAAQRTMILYAPGINGVSYESTEFSAKFTGDIHEVMLYFSLPGNISGISAGSPVFLAASQYYDILTFT